MFQALEEMGYSVLGLGVRDFSFGVDFLLSMEKKHGLTFVGTNLLSSETRTHFFRPHVVMRVGQGRILGIPFGGMRIGVISVIGKDTPPYAGDRGDSLLLLQPVEAARHYSRQLRQKCDLIVVLAYTNQTALDSLLSLPDVDMVIATRTLTVPSGYQNVGMRKHAVLAYTGYEARRIGVVTVKLSPAGRILSAKGELIVLGKNRPEDPGMNALISEAKRAVSALPDAGSQRQESHSRK
jgi:2',3'-cyclic-nucleotide 2'-phosphodiesterase (5'-nucleotidase family)